MLNTEALPVDQDWDVLLSFLPQDWCKLARDTGALKGLRKCKGADNSLRMLLLYLGCGHTLRETVDRARQTQLADLSDVALLKRLKKSGAWLHALCARLFEERNLTLVPGNELQVRAVNATTVIEPGPRGPVRRLHYSLNLPSLACDVKLTGTAGPGTEASLAQFPIRAGDHVLAGRGYSTARDIRHVDDAGGRLIVPVKTGSRIRPFNPGLPWLCSPTGRMFNLLAEVESLTRPGTIRAWPTTVKEYYAGPPREIPGRVCVLRKSAEAIRLAHERVRRDAAREGDAANASDLRMAEYVIVFTNFPEPLFSAADVLECYRLRWQLELVFERFSSLAQLGHVPKYDNDSAKAWFYGKLLVALLVEKLIRHASTVSPWGYDLPTTACSQPTT